MLTVDHRSGQLSRMIEVAATLVTRNAVSRCRIATSPPGPAPGVPSTGRWWLQVKTAGSQTGYVLVPGGCAMDFERRRDFGIHCA